MNSFFRDPELLCIPLSPAPECTRNIKQWFILSPFLFLSCFQNDLKPVQKLWPIKLETSIFMQSKWLHLTRAGCTDMLKNHFQRFLSKTLRKSSKWFFGIQRNNNLKSICFVSMLPRCSVTFEVRTEKFPFSPVKDMLWTKEKSPSCHSSKMMDIKMSINTCIFFNF